jgi:drug/metabolite transporter (DMT)-like permease
MVVVDRPGAAAALLPALALMFNAFVWGVSWWPLRALQERGLHPLWSTAVIYIVSLAWLLAVRPQAWRGFGAQPQLWLLVAAAGLTNVGFNWAVTVGDVVRVVLLFYLMPAWAVLLAWLLLGERPTAAALLQLVLALAGVAVVLGAGPSGWPVPSGLADWLALMGGFSFALTNILLRKLQAAPAPSRILAMFGGGAAMAMVAGVLGMGQGIVSAPVWPAGAVLHALALSLAFLVANVALQYGAARLAAQTTALIMLSEVIFASVSSLAAGSAEPAPRIFAGGALILAAAAWSAWPRPRPAGAQ